MASKDAIAIKRQRATVRLNDTIRTLGQMCGRQYPALPTQGRDPSLVHANQLTALADILDDVLKNSAISISIKEGVNASNTN